MQCSPRPPTRASLCHCHRRLRSDLKQLAVAGVFEAPVAAAFQKPTLNAFMALGYDAWLATRKTLTQLFSSSESTLRDNAALRAAVLIPSNECTFYLPAQIGDYTDFYASREHASNLDRCSVPQPPKRTGCPARRLRPRAAWWSRVPHYAPNGEGPARGAASVRPFDDDNFELRWVCGSVPRTRSAAL